MHGFGYADAWGILQVPGNKANTVPCERLQKMAAGSFQSNRPSDDDLFDSYNAFL